MSHWVFEKRKKMKKIIISIIITAVIATVGWLVSVKGPTFLIQIFSKKAANESVSLSEINPFETDTNPFSGSYKNPFNNQ
jgi:hypothetical protein